MSCSERWSTRIDRVLRGDAGRGPWRRLRAHLDGCAACRATYDRAAEAMGIFEGGLPEGVRAHLEADLFAALGPAPKPARRWIPASVAIFAAAAAASLALVLRAPEAPTLQARGASGGDVGFRMFCLRTGPGGATVRDEATSAASAPARCSLEDRLQFTWSSTGGARHLALFAVGPRGEILWYWPRGDAPSTLAGGTDQPLPGSFDLRARHGPGRYHVFGIFSDAPVPRYAVERLLGWTGRLTLAPALPDTLPFPGKVVDAWLELR